MSEVYFKKNPDEKYYFFWEKIDFEKKIAKFYWPKKFSSENLKFFGNPKQKMGKFCPQNRKFVATNFRFWGQNFQMLIKNY